MCYKLCSVAVLGVGMTAWVVHLNHLDVSLDGLLVSHTTTLCFQMLLLAGIKMLIRWWCKLGTLGTYGSL